MFTVSGVVAAFRRSALERVGFWDLDKLTDDIDISWRLQMDHWSIRFESNALCWILMPETLKGLWRQPGAVLAAERDDHARGGTPDPVRPPPPRDLGEPGQGGAVPCARGMRITA